MVEAKAVSGDNNLGGDDWDQRLLNHLVQHARNVSGVDLSRDKTALQRLREAAEQAKIDLSSAAESQISVPYIAQSAGGPVHLQTTLTRAAFQAMTADLLDRCKSPFSEVMMGAGDIGHVVVAGGATRMPAIAALVRELAGDKGPAGSVSPDEAVAAGAAWLAGALAGTAKSPLLLSATPWSLGVKTKSGTIAKLVERNTTVPVSRSMAFAASRGLRTAASGSGSHAAPSAHGTGDTGMTIGIYQGEHVLAADSRLVGVLQLTGVPLTPGRWREIEMTIDMDADAVPRVTARDVRTGREKSAIITGSPALTADEADPLSGGIELEVRKDMPGNRQRDEETIDLEPSPEASRAAREHALGRLRQSFTVPSGSKLGKPQEIQVFEFEQGLLEQRPGSPPDTFRWDQIATVRQDSTATYTNGVYGSTSFVYTIISHDGQSAQIAGSYRDPARVPAAAWSTVDDPKASVWRRYAALGAAVARHVATAQLPAAKAALDRGEKLAFGNFAISASGMSAGRRGPLPWSLISDVQVTDGVVSIKQSGESAPFSRRPVSKIPNFLLFTTLADMLRKPIPG
jgi:hypothetical protein